MTTPDFVAALHAAGRGDGMTDTPTRTCPPAEEPEKEPPPVTILEFTRLASLIAEAADPPEWRPGGGCEVTGDGLHALATLTDGGEVRVIRCTGTTYTRPLGVFDCWSNAAPQYDCCMITSIEVTDATAAVVRDQAARAGMSVDAYIRHLALVESARQHAGVLDEDFYAAAEAERLAG